MGYYLYIGFVYIIVMLAAVWRSERLGLESRHALNLFLIVMIFGLLGARLLHIFYENPEVYARDPYQAFRLWQGGFVFFGGAFAAFFACWAYVIYHKLSFNEWGDFCAPLVALGYGLGRGGCLIAGCCYGGVCELPWAIDHRHPTQAYAIITELSLLAFLLWVERQIHHLPEKKRASFSGLIFSIWLIGHGCGRLFMESFRDDYRGSAMGPLSLSSWLSLVLIIFGAVRIVMARKNFLLQK